jgi:hypothetical protein
MRGTFQLIRKPMDGMDLIDSFVFNKYAFISQLLGG